MMRKSAIPRWLGSAGFLFALAGCVALPTNDQTTAPSMADFNQGAPAQAETPDLFAGDALFVDLDTPTKFKPQLEFQIGSLAAQAEPTVTINIYQTKGELEVRRTDTIIENATFRFDKLSPGLVIGNGKMELGTPPKLTLDVALTVTSTDQTGNATVAIKASNVLASVYVADMRIKQAPGGLVITSIGNATRANDDNGVHLTEVSARIVQTIAPGFVHLPAAGPMRTRTVIASEPDPGNQVSGQRVHRQTYTVE